MSTLTDTNVTHPDTTVYFGSTNTCIACGEPFKDDDMVVRHTNHTVHASNYCLHEAFLSTGLDYRHKFPRRYVPVKNKFWSFMVHLVTTH